LRVGTLNRTEISAIRKKEAAASAALLDGRYHCMECDDIFIAYDAHLVESHQASSGRFSLDILHMSPEDYILIIDSQSVSTACFQQV